VRSVVGVQQDGNTGDARRDLLEHPEQFRSQARLHNREAGQVAAGMSEALHQAISDRITAADEDHRNRASRLLRRFRRGVAVGEHHIRRLTQYPHNRRSHPIGVTRAPVIIDLKISTDRPADLLELVLECRGAELSLRIVLGVQHEYADPTGPVGLRTGDKRRGRRSACKHNDELAPPHAAPLGSRQGIIAGSN
jgi:hypothetical protein